MRNAIDEDKLWEDVNSYLDAERCRKYASEMLDDPADRSKVIDLIAYALANVGDRHGGHVDAAWDDDLNKSVKAIAENMHIDMTQEFLGSQRDF